MDADFFLEKAKESLQGAHSEFANKRYNNCANRCYYTCFQAAIAALLQKNIKPTGRQWSHTFVHGKFAEELIKRQKLYASEFKDILIHTLELRQTADYKPEGISKTQANRAFKRTSLFLDALKKGGEKQ